MGGVCVWWRGSGRGCGAEGGCGQEGCVGEVVG